MGRRGPVPTPRAILAERGSWRAGLNPNQPMPPPGMPPFPRGFTGQSGILREARRVWRQLIPQLDELGVLSQIDGHSLERYCWLRGVLKMLQREIETKGFDRASVKKIIKLNAALQRYEDRFGLDPASRARLSVWFVGGLW